MKRDSELIKKTMITFFIIDFLFFLFVVFIVFFLDDVVHMLVSRDILYGYNSDYIKVNIGYIFLMFNYSGILLLLTQSYFERAYYNSKNHTLERKFVTYERAYFFLWLILSLLYFVVIFWFNNHMPFAYEEKGIFSVRKGFFSVILWSGTIFYVASALVLLIANYNFCKNILNYKKYKVLFSKFTRSISTAITSWLIVIAFIYNNSNNKQLPFNFFMFYITLSIVVAFLYPLLDMYEYTIGEVENHQNELEKIKKEQYKYNHYNYK
ncbi:hypothetical protein [Lactobacillus apis]|uniref:hypothetical protein n=1 Tax=Lactobacillus apis TaxID=303541 RepID=UPI00164F910E|nr:hypothetical protein [Lactobacillus apis]MBC6360592.1 hypothetical protein [Lactobacillus apis]